MSLEAFMIEQLTALESPLPDDGGDLFLRFHARMASEGSLHEDSSASAAPPGGRILTYRTAGRGQNGESSN